jgi:hypothetical protein
MLSIEEIVSHIIFLMTNLITFKYKNKDGGYIYRNLEQDFKKHCLKVSKPLFGLI